MAHLGRRLPSRSCPLLSPADIEWSRPLLTLWVRRAYCLAALVQRVSADTLALQKRLGDALGLSVLIVEGRRGGTVSIRYLTLEQLDEVVRRLERKH